MSFSLTAERWIPEPYLDWFIALLAVILIISGCRAIKKRYAYTDVCESKGRWAVVLGWFWIVLGVLFIVTVIFDLPSAKKIVTFFVKNRD